MIIEIRMKTPDALKDAIRLKVLEERPELFDDEKYYLIEDLAKQAEPWFDYGEYVTLVFDTDEDTMTVKSH